MNILKGDISYIQSRNIEGSNIRIDYFTGYIENKASYEKRIGEESPDSESLGPVFLASIGNVAMVHDVIFGLCKSIAMTNETLYDTKTVIYVSYDNSVNLRKNYIITIYLPDIGGCIIVHCDHLYMSMVDPESRANDVYNIQLDFFNELEGILSNSGNKTPAITFTEKQSISKEISDETVSKEKNYDSKIRELLDLLAKETPNVVPSDKYVLENIVTNSLLN